MVKRNIEKLAIYSTKEETETIPFQQLRKLYLEKTSEIIYITKGQRLYGIICMREALAAHEQNGAAGIKKIFNVLHESNVIKAHEIFRDNRHIHKIPIVNNSGELVGDYSRWDDMAYIEQNHFWFMEENRVKKILEPYEAVYIIEPVEKEHPMYLGLCNYLNGFNICYKILRKEQIGTRLTEKAICIFLNEDERRGVQCLYGLMPSQQKRRENVFRYDMLANPHYKIRMATYRTFLHQLMLENKLERLKINWSNSMSCELIDDKATVLLTELQNRGVRCFCLYEYENEPTEYGKNFLSEVQERLKNSLLHTVEKMWTAHEKRAEFYEELYQIDAYRNGIVQKELYDAGRTFECTKKIAGKYFNAENGKRATCFQPEEYIGTIYLFGPCDILGVLEEDQYTIESYLQKQLLEKGYLYKVENYGAMSRSDSCIDSRLKEVGQYGRNDVVIYLSRIGKAVGIQGISIEKIFENFQISSKWVTDAYIHCNHKVNQLIAASICHLLEPLLEQDYQKRNCKEVPIDIGSVMKAYIQHKYLELYFADFNGEDYHSVGAVVMNCNPFSMGHRYLIETAMKQVEFLIIFVVEENQSLFPFEERFELIQEGTKDLKNIMIVPSGEFILSQNNFFEYFLKQEDATVTINAEYDIGIFADYIAEPLHITHRFAGEEPTDKVTAVYNEAMKRILPQKGIVFVEIPRMKIDGTYVSATEVRKYLKDGVNDKAFMMLPKSTRQYLEKQM